MAKKKYILLASFLIISLGIAGCGGGDTTSPTTTATTSPPTTMKTTTPPPQESSAPSPTTTEATPTQTPEPTTSEPEPTPTLEPTETPEPEPTEEPEDMEMAITSEAFQEGGGIPVKYSCDGQDVSPELSWSGVPAGTQSFVIILDDPDSPGGTFTHWVIYNVPADSDGLDEGVPRVLQLPDGTLQGRNSFGTNGYSGPCPPPGSSHRYYFTLYALDITLDLAGGASKGQVLAAVEGHVLAEAEIAGRYPG